jgi:hypothetical protein
MINAIVITMTFPCHFNREKKLTFSDNACYCCVMSPEACSGGCCSLSSPAYITPNLLFQRSATHLCLHQPRLCSPHHQFLLTPGTQTLSTSRSTAQPLNCRRLLCCQDRYIIVACPLRFRHHLRLRIDGTPRLPWRSNTRSMTVLIGKKGLRIEFAE